MEAVGSHLIKLFCNQHQDVHAEVFGHPKCNASSGRGMKVTHPSLFAGRASDTTIRHAQRPAYLGRNGHSLVWCVDNYPDFQQVISQVQSPGGVRLS